MKPNLTRLISEVLSLPCDALDYEVSRRLHDLFPDKFILETDDYDFDLGEYAASGKCMILLLDDAFGHFDAKWLGQSKGHAFDPMNGYFEIQWRGIRINCLSLTYRGGTRHFLIADRAQDAIELFRAVCSLQIDAEGEILVFSNGYWQRSPELMRQIRDVSLEELVLPENVREEMVRDAERFFAASNLYERHGLAWKRGMLLLGPPGNGKTLTIKALINHLGKPCLYIRSFSAENLTTHRCIAKVFERAREVAPCILVMEDLDSLIDSDDLSFLLNELDGFSKNRGILTIATTNHPEKLDSAIMQRPSRFDRKIEFRNPGRAERRRLLELADALREEGYRLAPEELDGLAEATDGFSFAYLRELDVTGMTTCLLDGKLSIGEAMLRQVEVLRRHMKSALEESAASVL